MAKFINRRFPYLDKLQHRLLHVFIIMIFSALFLIIFEPFNIKSWLKHPEWLKELGLISLAIFITATIAFSQLVIRTILKIENFKISHLAVWLLFEIILITFIVTLIYADNSNGFLNELFLTLRFTSVGLVLPYVFSLLILILIHQKSELAETEISSNRVNSDLINIKDEREQVKFSVYKPSVLYIESADNYVTIFHLQEGELKKEMVRNSMKKIEAQLSPYNLVRCHQSFIVNTENVLSVKKNGRNYQIKIKNCDTIIPVSRGYLPEVKSRILK